MEVKPGYKQTEVGVIPAEWEVVSLGKCLVARPDYGINAPAVPYSDRLPVYIRITDITEDGRFLPDKRVSVKSASSGNYYLSDGDIVFARTGASVGKSYRYNLHDGPLVFAGFLIRVRPDPQKSLPAFIAAYVTTGTYWAWVRLMSMRSGQPGINGNEYSQLPIPKPPAPEQRAIATALSDVDALLGALDRLIAKKRDLKQAAMQQLLTGQSRLPGFHGEWEVKRLGESCETITKGTTPTSIGRNFTESGVNFLKAEGISESGEPLLDILAFIDTATHKLLKRSQLKEGDLLISIAGVLGRVGRVSSDILPANTNQALAIVRLGRSSKLDRSFLFYCLRSPMTTKQISDVNVQAAQANISLQNVRDLEIHVPPTRAEQIAIAAVLMDIDMELAALEQRFAKTRALKQGMMRELLTGKTRLVAPQVSHA
jgi:type I restriction enzyme S subunit